MGKLFSLIGAAFFGGLGLIITAATAYIFLTDGLDNLRGEPETGWGAMIALILYVPIAAVSIFIAVLCRNRYKRYLLPK